MSLWGYFIFCVLKAYNHGHTVNVYYFKQKHHGKTSYLTFINPDIETWWYLAPLYLQEPWKQVCFFRPKMMVILLTFYAQAVKSNIVTLHMLEHKNIVILDALYIIRQRSITILNWAQCALTASTYNDAWHPTTLSHCHPSYLNQYLFAGFVVV